MNILIISFYLKCKVFFSVAELELFGDLVPEPKLNLILVLLLHNSFKWQYMAVAGAGAEIMDKVGAGAENK